MATNNDATSTTVGQQADLRGDQCDQPGCRATEDISHMKCIDGEIAVVCESCCDGCS